MDPHFVSDDSKKEKTEIQAAHPTSLIRCSCLCLLRALAIATGLHSAKVHVDSVRTVSGLLRTLVNAGIAGTVFFFLLVGFTY